MKTPDGMRTFIIIWAGQLVSLVGTAMTRFALLVWTYERTGTATSVALVGLAGLLPIVIFSPIAGVVVDRFDRRWVMLLTDTGAGVMTMVLIGLNFAGTLELWHVYLLLAMSGFFESFQAPAYTAASTVLIPKASYARASGMRSLAESATQLLSPFFAAALLPFVGLGGVMLADVATFIFALVTLMLVRVPAPPAVENDVVGFGAQIQSGFRFIFARNGLVGLMAVMMGMNLTAGLTYSSVMPAMILGRTGGSELALAVVQGALGVGTIVGAILVSIYGLPKRLIHAILGAGVLTFMLGDAQLGLGSNVILWSLGAFSASVFIPFIWGAYQTIWQQKTPPGIQGRVLAAENMMRKVMLVTGFMLAGPLADRVFEPAMSEGGQLADVFGTWVGVGPGSGIGLMFLCTAAMGTAFSLIGYTLPAVRRVQEELPDHDAPYGPIEDVTASIRYPT